MAGTAGGLIAVGVIAIIYPERGGLPNEFSSIQHIKESGDLFQHTLGGGIITTVVGSLTNPKLGLISGVSVGLLKEVIDYSDGDLGSHAQLSDFLATAAGSLASYILQDYVDSKFKITENSIALDFNF